MSQEEFDFIEFLKSLFTLAVLLYLLLLFAQ